MMTCEELAQLLPDLVDGTLSPEVRAEAETALAQCPDCQREFELVRQVRAFLVTLHAEHPELRVPAGFEARFMAQIKRQNSGLELLELSSKAFGLWLVELINLVGGLLDPHFIPQSGIDFIPRFINGLIILIIGYLLCVIIRWILRFVFRQIRLEQLTERTGIDNALRGLGMRTPLPQILVQIIFFFLILSFATEAVRLMGLTAVATLLESVLIFIPKAISAALLLIFGSMLGRFLGNTIATVAENVNITYGKALGKVIEYAIVAFVVVLAISTLGVDTTILTSSFTIIIASAGLAIALTFAFGSRESARNVIAGYYVRQNFQTGQMLSIDTYAGRLLSVSGAYTTLEVFNQAGERSTISLPNTLLLKRAVEGRENPPLATNGQPDGPNIPQP